ncbi:MAG: DNA polymerase III subunit gamma/tau [Gammaproteobacteria bacterium]|nr:DNA polymerase III subunit gamma/tau [Gammaproteobacteria bacterium]
MSYQVLARKWRPHGFGELVGQEHVVRALSNALDNDRVHHAYLFTGTRGVGKTTLARILAKSLNCETGVSSAPCGECASCREIDEGRFVDLIEVDAASRTKVDQTRELLENVPYAPVSGRYKVYLIDEVHMFSDSSFNALLKTLEEPPPHVKFLLATTDPQKVPVTVLSRCLQFNLKRLPVDQIQGQLKTILEAEKIFFDVSALQLLSIAADGSMRDALSLMDQAIVFGGGQVRDDDVRAMLGTIPQDYVFELLEALVANNGVTLMRQVDEMAQKSVDFVSLLKTLLTFLHRMAMVQQASVDWFEDDIDKQKLQGMISRISAEDIQLYYQMALMGQNDLNLAPDPRMGFEMLMLRMLAFSPNDVEAGVKPISKPKSVQQKSAVKTTPTKPAPKPTAEPVATVDKKNRDWPTVIRQLGLGGLTGQFAGHCAVKSWDNGKLVLTLDPQHKSLQGSRAEQMLIKALANNFDGLTAEIIVESPAGATPQQLKTQQKQDKQASAVEDVRHNPYVEAMQQTFDAQVVEESIKPVE